MKKLREYKKTNVILSAVIFLVVGGFLTVNALAAWENSGGGHSYHTSGNVAINTNSYAGNLKVQGNHDTQTPAIVIANTGSNAEASMRFNLDWIDESWAMGQKRSDKSFRLTFKADDNAKLSDKTYFKIGNDGAVCLGDC